ncbi:hypothetical protein ABZP36_002328 [Zizania latifolia]
MDRAKKSCLPIILILLVPIVHGARHAPDVKGTGTDVAVAVRTSTAAGHGHGYSTSHRSSRDPSGNPEDGGSGTPAVDHHNVAAQAEHTHHHHGAASRRGAAVGYSRLATCTLLGAATFLLVLA